MNGQERTAPLSREEWSTLVRRIERIDGALAFGFGREHVTYDQWRDLMRELLLALEYYHARDEAARGELTEPASRGDD